MNSTPKNEHEVTETFVETEFYEDHGGPRKSTPTFEHTKHEGKKAGMRCAVTLSLDKLEYHHVFVEWAASDSVDWGIMKGLGTGTITELPVLDPYTFQPTGEMAPARYSLAYFIAKFTEHLGFDWQAFDPAKPETFVDSIYNMLVLHERFHRAKNHGIHCRTFPTWLIQCLPKKPGFVFAPDDGGKQ